MKFRSLLVVALLGLGATAFAGDPAATAPAPAPAPPAPAPVTYKLDPSKGFVYIQVFKDPTTLASGLSHDHVIRAMGWTGAVTWDPANPATCKVDINVPVAQLLVDAPEMRKKVGYDTVLDDSQREDVTKNMLSDEQLDGKKYPNITFKATKCEGTGDSVKVTGGLTIHGVTKTVTVPMKVTNGDAFTAKGSLHILATDYGFEPYSALLGQLKNQNDMTLTIDVVGAR